MLVTESLHGGIGELVRAQAGWFAAAGWSVDVVSQATSETDVPAAPLTEIVMPTSARDARAMARAARALRGAVGALEPDLVHAHGLRAFALTLLAGVRPAVTLHVPGGVPSDPAGYRVVRRAALEAAPRLARLAFSAVYGVPSTWRFAAHASPKLPTLSSLGPPPEDEIPTFLWLGRLAEQKLPATFVRAVAQASRVRHLRGVMAGSGDQDAALRELVADLGAPIEFVGEVTDVRPLLRRCSAVALFSRNEAVSLAVQEAMWAGRAVVCSDLPSLRWLVDGAGLIARSQDEAAAAFVRLCEPGVAASLGDLAARRAHELLTPNAPWPDIEERFTALLASNGRPHGYRAPC